MTTSEILGLLASNDAVTRQSLTGPEWFEIVLGNSHVMPLPAIDFDRLLEARLIEARDEGSFTIAAAGRRWLVTHDA